MDTEIHVTRWPVENELGGVAIELESAETWHPDFAATVYREQARYYRIAWLDFDDKSVTVPVAMTYQWERRSS